MAHRRPHPLGRHRGRPGQYWPGQRPPFQARPRQRPPAPASSVGSQRTTEVAQVEAVLLTADEPLPARRIAQLAGLAEDREAERCLDWLRRAYLADRSGFELIELASGYRLLTARDLRPAVDALVGPDARLQLTPAVVEALAIIAYRQPLTRADIEALRGANCAEAIKQLTDAGLIRTVGQEDSLGRPFLYGTTRTFLDEFGLRSLDDLSAHPALRASAVGADGADASVTSPAESAAGAPADESPPDEPELANEESSALRQTDDGKNIGDIPSQRAA